MSKIIIIYYILFNGNLLYSFEIVKIERYHYLGYKTSTIANIKNLIKFLKNKIKLFLSLKLIIIYYLLFFLFSNNNKVAFQALQKLVMTKKKNKINRSTGDCYESEEFLNKTILHFVITRFLFTFSPKKVFSEQYIKNGLRVMKTYLLPSLEAQKCKNFTWILMLGDSANITFLKSLIDFNTTFDYKLVYYKDINKLINESTKNIDIFISSGMDYDDRIFYDAVNDVRKRINLTYPIFFFGYHNGYIYFENTGIYGISPYKYEGGAINIFLSSILNLHKTNGAYYIYQFNDLGSHISVKTDFIKNENYKKFGLKKLDYNPAEFEHKEPKFVYVRQNYSHSFALTKTVKAVINNFDLDKFYGRKDN